MLMPKTKDNLKRAEKVVVNLKNVFKRLDSETQNTVGLIRERVAMGIILPSYNILEQDVAYLENIFNFNYVLLEGPELFEHFLRTK